MKKYLSFGGGVNSVAMMLLMLDQKEEFEAIFVDHGTDWPETYEYFEMFQGWLKDHGYKQITVLKPCVLIKKSQMEFNSIYDYAYFRKMVPSGFMRWCTGDFKIRPIHKYVETPCFMLIGIDFSEAKRAKISTNKGIENRYPLLENEIDRDRCKKIIIDHGLPVPMKSGCYICPFQKRTQWVELRHKHPELFCKAQKLEDRNIEYQKGKGKKPKTLSNSRKKLGSLVEENQMNLFEQDDYPPCQCGL